MSLKVVSGFKNFKPKRKYVSARDTIKKFAEGKESGFASNKNFKPQHRKQQLKKCGMNTVAKKQLKKSWSEIQTEEKAQETMTSQGLHSENSSCRALINTQVSFNSHLLSNFGFE